MRVRAITVINTAHVKALSAFKSFRKVLCYIEKAGMQWPEAVPCNIHNTAYTKRKHTQ